MKKSSRVFALVLACFLVMQVFGLVACNNDTPNPDDNTKKYDQETRAFTMSISTPDGVFNPYFSSSAYDSQIVGLTQIGMLNTDKNGKIVCGEDEPTVVKAYTVKEEGEYTNYEFLIKNGIKFSDGEPLTIKDVLFNLYLYLDPAYTGSSTIYSTDIVGLKSYRQQQLQPGDETEFEQSFASAANKRISDLVNYVRYEGVAGKDEECSKPADDAYPQLEKDFETVAAKFLEELNRDWNAIDMTSYKENNEFTDKWQVFLLNDGGYSELLRKENNKTYKDENGNFKLDAAAAQTIYNDEIKSYVEELMAADKSLTKEAAEQQVCVNSVFGSFFPKTSDGKYNVKSTQASSFESVVTNWGTASTIADLFAAEAKKQHFANNGKAVPSISGITTKKVTSFEGVSREKMNNEEYDVLCIKINGVDPKAIYNFSFTVSPMHYYSTNGGYTNSKGEKHNYIDEFDGVTNFGLEFGDITFMNTVINAPEKVGLPLGAGSYMASNETGDQSKVSADTFFDKNMVYYERNPYFETVGKKLSNAKIKYLKYKVVETDQVIGALINGDIDFGEPNATQENKTALKEAGITSVQTMTSGYGYVGINPRFVPNINVRRAIMKAMDTSIIVQNYYKGGLASIIYRPMSKASWAYPDGATVYKDEAKGLNYSYDSTGAEIKALVEEAGYRLNGNGVYEKTINGFGTDTLNYKFTIAGGSTDHPAYAMFLNAVKVLNANGFDVQVVTSQTALSDLSTGKLAVWAAAWSSTVDPDMYQVYHKDSKASSTNNWGYSYIKGTLKDSVYKTEWQLVQDLSDLIDQGRETTDQKERTEIYAEALDKIMELAVEFPTYQRNDLAAFRGEILKRASMTNDKDLTPYNGLLSRIWEVEYN